MNRERGKALTEAMGGCWHKAMHPLYVHECLNGCGAMLNQPATKQINQDFSTWQGFGELVVWAKEQDWWESFCANLDPLKTFGCWEALVDPDRFANAVFEYLKPCCDHEWGTDGLHSNIFCKKCFKSQKQINKKS